jgi:hypothetical protein
MSKFPLNSMPTIGISNLGHCYECAEAKLLLLFVFVATITACASGDIYARNDPRACLTVQQVQCPRHLAQFVDRFGCTSCIFLPPGELRQR